MDAVLGDIYAGQRMMLEARIEDGAARSRSTIWGYSTTAGA